MTPLQKERRALGQVQGASRLVPAKVAAPLGNPRSSRSPPCAALRGGATEAVVSPKGSHTPHAVGAAAADGLANIASKSGSIRGMLVLVAASSARGLPSLSECSASISSSVMRGAFGTAASSAFAAASAASFSSSSFLAALTLSSASYSSSSLIPRWGLLRGFLVSHPSHRWERSWQLQLKSANHRIRMPHSRRLRVASTLECRAPSRTQTQTQTNFSWSHEGASPFQIVFSPIQHPILAP